MRFARGDVRGPHRFTQNRPRSFVAAPQNVTAEEKSKNQLSRDFWCCPIFDFCNSIGTFRTCRSDLTKSVLGGWSQPVDATQALNLSAGVSNCKPSGGR